MFGILGGGMVPLPKSALALYSCNIALDFFYRATLCVSAVFAVARCPSICMSVRLSHWWIIGLCKRLKMSSNFFLGPVSPLFFYLDSQRRYPIPRETSSAGWVGKFAIFD